MILIMKFTPCPQEQEQGRKQKTERLMVAGMLLWILCYLNYPEIYNFQQ
jgi:hypothetical protein